MHIFLFYKIRIIVIDIVLEFFKNTLESADDVKKKKRKLMEHDSFLS